MPSPSTRDRVALATTEAPMKQERESKIRVVVNRSTEAIDFDAWAAAYVQDVLAIVREQRRQQEAA